MATQAQLDEKARKDREGLLFSTTFQAATPAQLAEKGRGAQPSSSSLTEAATPAQLAEKLRRDRPGSSFAGAATPAQLAEKGRPPLPPRAGSSTAPPPPYTSDDAKRNELVSKQWRSHDPRSSSTHSLVPSESGRDGRRTLLLVFIHGFMGNETSFQSFPAHVHNLLTITLAETHVVHTKIYPRYKSRKAIEFARDDLGTWYAHPSRETHLAHKHLGLKNMKTATPRSSYWGIAWVGYSLRKWLSRGHQHQLRGGLSGIEYWAR